MLLNCTSRKLVARGFFKSLHDGGDVIVGDGGALRGFAMTPSIVDLTDVRGPTCRLTTESSGSEVTRGYGIQCSPISNAAYDRCVWPLPAGTIYFASNYTQ